MPFDALTVAKELIPLLRGSVAAVAVNDSDLARQIRRAATSIALNLSEGRERAGRDRLHLYRIALGSAAEVVTALELASGWGYLEPDALAPALAALDRVRAMLWRLTRA